MGFEKYKNGACSCGGIADIESGAIDGGMDDLSVFIKTTYSYLCSRRSDNSTEDDGISGEVGDSSVPDMQRRG
jgi:hypothetical protein